MSSSRRESISEEKKLLIFQAHRELVPIKVIARMYQVKESTVRSVVHRFLKNGVVSKKRKGRSKKLNSEQINSIREWIDEDCTRSLEWLSDKVKEVFDIDVSISTVSRYVDDVLAYSYKRLAVVPVRRNYASTKETRRNYALRFFDG